MITERSRKSQIFFLRLAAGENGGILAIMKMKTLVPLLVPIVLLASARGWAQGEPGFAVVELFTSEGCSSCPPADGVLAALARRAEHERLPVFALAWHVDYWDYLGWTDPFGSRLATLRQYAYASALPSQVYTPQMVINGSIVPSYAGDSGEVGRIVGELIEERAAVRLAIEALPGDLPGSYRVRLSLAGAPRGARLELVVTEGGLSAVPKAGENAGRRLLHSSVVRFAEALEAAHRLDALVRLPAGADPERCRLVAFVQDPTSLKILGAAGTSLGSAGVRGRVVDERGLGLAGVPVRACSGLLCVPALSDREGFFALTLRPGRYEIELGGARAQAALTLEVGAGERVELPPLAVRG